MEKIKQIATQLSKITDNIRYDFPNNEKQGSLTGYVDKSIDQFFRDASMFVDILNINEDVFDKACVLTFDNTLDKDKAQLVLQAMNYNLVDFGESFDQDRSVCILIYDETVFDFVFNNKQKESSVHKLYRLLGSEFTFYIENIYISQEYGVGKINQIGLEVKELYESFYSITDVDEDKLNNHLIQLIDFCPTYEAFKKIEKYVNN